MLREALQHQETRVINCFYFYSRVADINKLIGNSSNECLEFKTEITKTLKEQKSTLEHLQNKANQDQKR